MLMQCHRHEEVCQSGGALVHHEIHVAVMPPFIQVRIYRDGSRPVLVAAGNAPVPIHMPCRHRQHIQRPRVDRGGKIISPLCPCSLKSVSFVSSALFQYSALAVLETAKLQSILLYSCPFFVSFASPFRLSRLSSKALRSFSASKIMRFCLFSSL